MSNWDSIVRTHGPLVFRVAWRILGHAADTEDVVQDVFLEAHQLHQREPIKHWPGLLHRLAAFRALDRLRQRKPTVALDDLSLADDTDEPEEAAIGRELADRLRQSVAELPEREGTVFCLRFFDDLSYQQIAETLTISPAAVAVALHKARAKLETLLNPETMGKKGTFS